MSETTQDNPDNHWPTMATYWHAIVHHWRGHYPVWQSFWFNYLSVSTCLLLVIIWCLILALLFDFPHFDHLVTACAVVQSGVWIWALVGTFRAARNDVGGIASSLRKIATNTFLVINILGAFGCAAIATVVYIEIAGRLHH
jgi:hypothetical protein